MEDNNLIFFFSIFIFSIGIVMFFLMSKQFQKMSQTKFKGGEEGGPRAYLFNRLDEFFSEAEDMPTELMHVKKQEIKDIIDKMD